MTITGESTAMRNHSLLDTIDPEVAGALVSRREAIRKGASVRALAAAGLAAGSIPLARGALASEAGAQGPVDAPLDWDGEAGTHGQGQACEHRQAGRGGH